MSDPRDRDVYRSDLEHTRRLGSGMNSAWGWIAGGVFVLVVLVLVFGYGMNENTASTTTPPMAATTGAGSTSSAPSATPSPPSPSTPSNPTNGGQAR
jgi:hypothetical protein